jgi:16S rRNA processing protein RimM
MRPSGRARAPHRSPEPPEDGLVEVGRITGRHGVRGKVRLRLHNPGSTALSRVDRVVLRSAQDGGERAVRLLEARRHKYGVLLRLEGVETADQAAALVDQTLCVRRDDLPPLEPHEVYYTELTGSVVRLQSGELVGVVREVFATGSNDVLVVEGRQREYLIPFIADVIVRVDAPARVVVIEPIPGLLDS